MQTVQAQNERRRTKSPRAAPTSKARNSSSHKMALVDILTNIRRYGGGRARCDSRSVQVSFNPVSSQPISGLTWDRFGADLGPTVNWIPKSVSPLLQVSPYVGYNA